MTIDLWFARDSKGQLWAVTSMPGNPPYQPPARVPSVAFAYKKIKEKKVKVSAVGICDVEMLGL